MKSSSDLVGLVQVMCAVFGENSPVFAKGVGYSPPYKVPASRQASWPTHSQHGEFKGFYLDAFYP